MMKGLKDGNRDGQLTAQAVSAYSSSINTEYGLINFISFGPTVN